MSTNDTHRAIDAVWRIESPRLIAGLARIVRDVGLAEDLAHDALVAALEQWPASGVPANPGAWLMATAKNRAIDHCRRGKLLERKHEQLGYELEVEQALTAPDFDAALDDDIGDDLLRLVFTACHPVLSTDARAALTLRLLGGLTTDEIARAFLVPEPTVAQRIVRAKRTLAKERVPFEVPRGEELARARPAARTRTCAGTLTPEPESLIESTYVEPSSSRQQGARLQPPFHARSNGFAVRFRGAPGHSGVLSGGLESGL